MNHIADANKMVSDTPRTDEAVWQIEGGEMVCPKFCRQLERELNAANQRIKRLEDAGEKMVDEPLRKHRRWILNEAKEAKP